MSNEQLRLMVQSDVSSLLTGYMTQNNLPAYVMEDAVNKYMLTLKDETMKEFIKAISTPQESASIEQEEEENVK